MNRPRTDFELLRGFTRNGDQSAFAQVVRRHLDLVYATALRQAQEPGGAEEIVQNVFGALARKAWQFASDDSVPAWLYRTTLLEAKEWLRGELRRRRREQTAADLGTTMKTPDESSTLRALTPLLDEALLSLRERDRAALLLRFYEGRSLREVGLSLGVGEDAAQKRVAGALEKLADFFRKRGFKAATVGAAAAALEHTAASVPAQAANALVQAAAQMTPPVINGAVAFLARLASLTKVQTAALCLAVAAAPLSWEWIQTQKEQNETARLQSRLSLAQAQRSATQAETERLQKEWNRLNASLDRERESARENTEAAQQFEAWKTHVQTLLSAENYRWPTDSPFVRIPKSALKELSISRPIAPPGVVRQDARELLGLTAEERSEVEESLRRYFAALDSLIETSVYETNLASRLNVPASAAASKIWVVPPLGGQVQAQADQLKAALQTALGPERWPLVEPLLESYGTDTLRRVLCLDAGDEEQTLAVWVQQQNGTWKVCYGWAGRNVCFTSGGSALELFLPGETTPSGENPAEILGYRGLPEALTGRMLGWVQQEAVDLTGKQAAK